MTMKDIVIKIISDIRVEGEEPQKMEITMPAKFYKKGTSLFIAYDETELSGMAGDKTVLKVHQEEVTMTRYGGNASVMVFKVGEQCISDYKTPYGTFQMEYLTKQLDIHLTEEGTGGLEILYLLKVSGISTSVNDLKIDILS